MTPVCHAAAPSRCETATHDTNKGLKQRTSSLDVTAEADDEAGLVIVEDVTHQAHANPEVRKLLPGCAHDLSEVAVSDLVIDEEHAVSAGLDN